MNNCKNENGLTFPVTITNEWREVSFCEGLTPRALQTDSPEVRADAMKASQRAVIEGVAAMLGATVESIKEVGHE